MSRPASHQSQPHESCCGNCAFAHLIAYKLDLLCFHGDAIEITGKSEYPVSAEFVEMNGEEVGMMEGDAYSKLWADRIVDSDDVCSEWISESSMKTQHP